MNPIVFLGGVHGAGKTTIGRQLAVSLHTSHVTAGHLIREMESAVAAAAANTSKVVADVDANQDKLLRGLAFYRAHIGKGGIILDGHFTLFSSNETVAEIPLVIFRQIDPLALVLVETDAAVIHARLMKRDGKAPSHAAIATLAASESGHALTISRSLEIPVFLVDGDSSFDVIEKSISPQIKAILTGTA